MEEPTQPEKPKPEQRWQDGKRPLNVRPRRSQPRQVEFIEKLISEKGSAQEALVWCIDQAIQSFKPASHEEIALRKTIEEQKSKIKELEDQAARRPVLSPVVPEEMKKQLEKVMRVRKLQEAEAIAYCIKYTAKNDWL